MRYRQLHRMTTPFLQDLRKYTFFYTPRGYLHQIVNLVGFYEDDGICCLVFKLLDKDEYFTEKEGWDTFDCLAEQTVKEYLHNRLVFQVKTRKLYIIFDDDVKLQRYRNLAKKHHLPSFAQRKSTKYEKHWCNGKL